MHEKKLIFIFVSGHPLKITVHVWYSISHSSPVDGHMDRKLLKLWPQIQLMRRYPGKKEKTYQFMCYRSRNT
jgi:hypothetical protein